MAKPVVASPKTRRRARTFTGCYNCRARKVKCNEAIPECGPCKKHGIACSGYQSKLVWVTPDQKSYQPNGRRFLQCESTWSETPVMSSKELDYFVSLCDAAQYVKDFTVEWCPQSRIPFGAFPIQNRSLKSTPSPLKLTRTLTYGAPLKDEEAFLFQHYVNHVALLMMPYEDHRNPWKSSYPAVALYYMSQNQRCLYKALLAQAAFNLAHLGCGREKILDLAAKYYTSAMEELRASFIQQQEDSGTFIASIMTLLMVEIYSGNSRSWRAHLKGAWSFLRDHQNCQPWATSPFAESSTQSLCIIQIVSDTSAMELEEPTDFDHTSITTHKSFVSSITSSASFGFTIGATGLLMTCIADIRRLAYGLKMGTSSQSIEDTARVLFERLDQCRETSVDDLRAGVDPDDRQSESLKDKMMALYHMNAFIAATYIYLYQTLFELPPSHVRQYVAEVFHNVQAFFAVGNGNLSLWPAFIAAVVAYEPNDMEAARKWLEAASAVGMGNRLKIRAVVEEVWRLREVTSLETGQDIGSINIDWRNVMQKLDLDVLLV